MLRLIFCAAFIVITSLNLFSADAKDVDAVQGTWLPVEAELGGQKFPDEVRKTIKLTIKGNAYTATVGAGTDAGTIALKPDAKPKALDIVGTEGPNKGKTFPCIYELDGDTWKICYDLSGKARPTEFKSTAGTKLYLVTYKREKP